MKLFGHMWKSTELFRHVWKSEELYFFLGSMSEAPPWGSEVRARRALLRTINLFVSCLRAFVAVQQHRQNQEDNLTIGGTYLSTRWERLVDTRCWEVGQHTLRDWSTRVVERLVNTRWEVGQDKGGPTLDSDDALFIYNFIQESKTYSQSQSLYNN